MTMALGMGKIVLIERSKEPVGLISFSFCLLGFVCLLACLFFFL